MSVLVLSIGDDLGHRHHGGAEFAVAALPVRHLANEIGRRKASHVGGFIVARAGRQMTRPASTHLPLFVAVLNDRGHRRVHVGEPVWDIVHVVRLGARDRERAAGRRGSHPVCLEAGRRLNLVRDRERPIRLFRRGRERRHERQRQDADEVLHAIAPTSLSFGRGMLSRRVR